MPRFDITGPSRILFMLGSPIRQVKAPARLNALAAARGVDAVLVPLHIDPPDLSIAFAGFRMMRNLEGMVITVPHKVTSAKLCDRLSERAMLVGAVNVIRRDGEGNLIGDMLDGLGFVAGLKTAGIPVAGRRAYLAGAGGAASAIALALVEAGVSHLTIANRSRDKAEDLANRLLKYHPLARISIGTRDPSGHDLVVNGTSFGMTPGDGAPLDLARLDPAMAVCEVIMEPELTPLLLAAKAIGCTIQGGRPMLGSQLELMADYFGLVKTN
jgi:shikimate dehydrogenase